MNAMPAAEWVLHCDVTGVEPDTVTVAVLARLQLACRHGAGRLQLVNAAPDLLDLIAFLGLAEVLTPYGAQPRPDDSV